MVLLEDKELTLVEHLTELRYRLLVSVGAVLLFSIVGFIYAEETINFLARPVGDLVFLSPAEAFFTHLKVAVLSGFMLALPFLLFQFWRFLLPALKQHEKKFLIILIPSSLILFLLGFSFCLYVVLPIGIRFFMGFATEGLLPMISLNSYISFLTRLIIPFGLVFEMPLIMGLLVRLRIITPEQIIRARKFIIVIIFVIGALLTPPDIISQILMALPLLLLFEGSLIISRIIAPKD